MTAVKTPETASALIARLERMRASPGVVLDRVDHDALAWAVELGERERRRLELERLERAEDDTQRLGPKPAR